MATKTILIGYGTCCISAGAEQVSNALRKEIMQLNLADTVQIKQTGCSGFSQLDPVIIIEPDGILYSGVKVEDAPEIARSLLPQGKPVEKLFYSSHTDKKPIPYKRDIEFYKKQKHIVLKNCGHIDPENIEDYIATGGYNALHKVLSKMTPLQVIDEVKKSGLRGLGGAGFPAGRKWEACYKAEGNEKYVICNADEGDPGSFQDRSVLEGDPHSVLEGMIIAGYAIGATKGYIYVRAEYPLAVKRLQIAISQAKERNFLGKNILKSSFDFDIEIFQGAGAFVCGESTALVLSIEGKRGMPKSLPRPRTTEVGLWDKPTLLNNVKTFANIRWIINEGADWFSSIGTEKSKGTAIFSIAGKIVNCGLVEVPMGITLREIIFDIGGGIPENRKFKSVQIGGPSGGCLPEELLDTPVDFDSLVSAGAIMGSGGMVVLDDTTCMVDVARYFLDFTQKESCGQCTHCRLGTLQMLEILKDICNGNGKEEDINLLVELGETIKIASLCGLGQSAPNPVLTTIQYFRKEYEEHIFEKKCSAKVCKSLISYYILPDKCKACMLCLKECPVNAISGGRKQVHVIDQTKCIRCGICLNVCPKKFGAIECVPGKI